MVDEADRDLDVAARIRKPLPLDQILERMRDGEFIADGRVDQCPLRGGGPLGRNGGLGGLCEPALGGVDSLFVGQHLDSVAGCCAICSADTLLSESARFGT